MLLKLFKHQQEVVDLKPKKWLLSHSTGTGKSLTAVRLVENYMQDGEQALIICPKFLAEQWTGKLPEYTDKPCSYDVITKETFRRDWSKLCKYKHIIIDEGHLGFANFKSQMHKAMMSYIKNVQPTTLFILTATPYTSSIWSLYSLGLILGKPYQWYMWKVRYFYEVMMGRRNIPVQKDKVDGVPIKEEIKRIVNELGNTVRMEDVLDDMPGQIFQTEMFDLTPEQKKAWKEIDDPQHIVKWTRRHQIENGILYSDGYTENRTFKCEKMDRAVALCQEHKKIAIVARYTGQLKALKAMLPDRKVFIIDGNLENKYETVEEINKLDDCVVLIQAATSVGYNLWSVHTMVFLSLDFALANLIQAQGRIFRADHPHPCLYVYLVNRAKSIDYDVYENVVLKKQDFHIHIFENK